MEYTGDSFRDLTRIARINENMWTELFMMNRQPLVDELDCIIARLTEYRDAIRDGDADDLRELLKAGSELKDLSNNQQ